MHGWGGYAAQMRAFVFHLAAAGLRVIAYDQPAHGLAEGRSAVLISPPSDVIGFSRRFARWHWIPERVRRAMQEAVEERFGVRWADLEVGKFAQRLEAAALVIHDRDDRMVPAWQGARLARVWPGARLLLTEGLGHGRILEDDTVTRVAADFIAGRSSVASAAEPPLAFPAPLY